ncbi:hypothetical protein B0H16DRAFT_1448405 [Mycena metata]|uniref:Uncharacterized protein n=1 Tax=Mycena metata TaxID=1033252 RepID=A0AAD7K7S6_9AGAR|nr:hypothetical protein B0H16DRAFT_1448405 [Mycena metata]
MADKFSFDSRRFLGIEHQQPYLWGYWGCWIVLFYLATLGCRVREDQGITYAAAPVGLGLGDFHMVPNYKYNASCSDASADHLARTQPSTFSTTKTPYFGNDPGSDRTSKPAKEHRRATTGLRARTTATGSVSAGVDPHLYARSKDTAAFFQSPVSGATTANYVVSPAKRKKKNLANFHWPRLESNERLADTLLERDQIFGTSADRRYCACLKWLDNWITPGVPT